MAYGQVNVNAGSRGGEFLVGNLHFFQIVTVVPSYPTNVKTPLAQALAARNWTSLSAARTITVVDGNGDSVTYQSDAAYTSAFNKQNNLDTLIQVFATRANPVLVNVTSAAVADGNGATVLTGGVNAVDFGSTYNGAQQGYFVNLAVERSPAWLVSTATADTNEAGYQLLNALNGVPVANTTAATPSGPQDASAAAVTVAGGTFVVSSSSNDRNVIARLRDGL